MKLPDFVTSLALDPLSRDRLSVLIYHRVLAIPDELLPDEPGAAEFEATMRLVKKLFNVIPLRDGVTGIKAGKLPPRALAITFDDGYANNATVAGPILSRLGLSATFFIATGFLDGGRMFNDTVIEAVRRCRDEVLDLEPLGLGQHRTSSLPERRMAIGAILQGIKYRHVSERARIADEIALRAQVVPPTDLMMTSEQASELVRAGFELGGHTVTHPILADLDLDSARAEIARGRARIEDMAGARVRLFAYPNGKPEKDYDKASVALVRELGFDGAVSTSVGAARVGSDPFQIPRFTPWSMRPLRFVTQMAANLVRGQASYATT